MNPSEILTGRVVFIMFLFLSAMAAYPFAKALLLYAVTRMLKFQVLSYRKSLFCILIGAGATLLVQMVGFSLALGAGLRFDPDAILEANRRYFFLGVILSTIVESIALLLFFKESPGKTIGAVVLTHAFLLVLLLFFIIVLMLFAMAFR